MLENYYDCFIEIPQGSSFVKYEFDKVQNRLRVDRFMNVAMYYPCNYGFIPQTLSKDGDPVDVLVITQYPIIAGAVLNIRPVAVLNMEDEAGFDEKIIAVPINKLDPYFNNVKDLADLNPVLLEKIKHFFERYKDLDKNKWVKVLDFHNQQYAVELIEEGFKRYQNEEQKTKIFE